MRRLCWHNWTPWGDPAQCPVKHVIGVLIVDGTEPRQIRKCRKCNKFLVRKVGDGHE